MFSFKSNQKKPLHSGSVRRFWARSILALFVMFCLPAALLFTGCAEPDGGHKNIHFIPAGDWKDSFNGGYKITASFFEYYTADMEWEGQTYPGESIKGNIEEANDFSSNAGVLLVRITSSSETANEGKFIGVYYKDYTTSHVFLANAIDESYALIVKNTLTEARNTFNVDNVETHIQSWGSGYNK